MTLGHARRSNAWSEQDRQDREKEAEQRERDRETRVYDQGRDDIDNGRYDRAIERFTDVARDEGRARRRRALLQSVGAGPSRAARRSARHARDADEGLSEEPLSRHRRRRSSRKCDSNSGQPVQPGDQSDDDLKLYAIAALQNSDPEQAVPMLEKLLEGTASPRVKSKALFVLAQSNSPRAREVLKKIAMGNSSPDLQNRAIDYLGTQGGNGEPRGARGNLHARRPTSTSSGASCARSWSRATRDRLLTAAQSEQNADLRAEAVQQLGVMGAHDALWQLYQKETAVDVKKRIIQAMFVGGDVDRLIELAKTEKNPELRRTAIRNLGIMGSKKASDALIEIYNTDKDPEIRKSGHQRALRPGQRLGSRRSRAQGTGSGDEEGDRVEALGDGLQGSGRHAIHDGTAERKVEAHHVDSVQGDRVGAGVATALATPRRGAAAAHPERRRSRRNRRDRRSRQSFRSLVSSHDRRRLDWLFRAGHRWRAGDVLLQLRHDVRRRHDVERVGLLRTVPARELVGHVDVAARPKRRRRGGRHQARRLRSDDRAVSGRESRSRPRFACSRKTASSTRAAGPFAGSRTSARPTASRCSSRYVDAPGRHEESCRPTAPSPRSRCTAIRPPTRRSSGSSLEAQPENVRKKVTFWLGNARGQRGFETLQRVLRDDPSIEVRKGAIFGLTPEQGSASGRYVDRDRAQRCRAAPAK